MLIAELDAHVTNAIVNAGSKYQERSCEEPVPLNQASASVPRLRHRQARLLHLAAQGLLLSPRRRARAEDLLQAIVRMRLLQIDTIHVIARSPYLVLHARQGDYPMSWLDDALAQGRLAECWAHEACFVPAADIGLHHGFRAARAGHWAHRNASRLHREQPAAMDALLQGIARSGPVRAADFGQPPARKSPGQVDGWWAWKPEKRWLEAWFALGELMVARRDSFQRVYDLRDRVLANLHPAPHRAQAASSVAELRLRFIADSVRALGVTQASWIADYYRLKPAVRDAELAPLLASGELRAVAVEGWPGTGYVHRDHAGLLERALRGRLRATHTALLSPFDPVVWDRSRLRAMFGFDYTLECYLPAGRRRHGYFVLPILHAGEMVGRLDAKAHRAAGVFEIRLLTLEPGITVSARRVSALARVLAASARWHGTPAIRLLACQPPSLAGLLAHAWRLLGVASG